MMLPIVWLGVRLGGKEEEGPGPQRGQNPRSGDGDIMCISKW